MQATTTDKQGKLLAMMRMNGLFESAYWVGALACYASVCLVSSLVATVVGVACGLQVYAHVSFMVHWVALWLFMVAMTASALFLAALVSRPRWVNLLSFLFLAFIIGYSFGLSVTPPNPPFFSLCSTWSPAGRPSPNSSTACFRCTTTTSCGWT